jgi:hypothetical protein
MGLACVGRERLTTLRIPAGFRLRWVSDEKAKELYGDFKAPKPYIRIIPQPA